MGAEPQQDRRGPIMSTMVRIGPAQQGQPMSLEELATSDFLEGYRYELIDGKLHVSPTPNAPEGFLETWALVKLVLYVAGHREVVNHVCPNARVFVPGRASVTNPQPDVAVYRDYPCDIDLREMRWQEVSPILVVEVLSPDNPNKDLVRNAELYHQVPSIKEYWVIDGRPDPNLPTLIVHRRYGKRWRALHFEHGDTYTTRLLPGFELRIDPRS
jgi:Uma2 family endonuclease